MDPVLIVDDEKDNLEALHRLLRREYEVTVTSSPFDALKLVQKTAFNVIVSDQRMPEMSGVELLEKVKNVSPRTTRILLTGYTDIDSVIGAINRGNIYRYVAKPWDPEELKLTLRQANEAFHLRRELEEKNEALSRSNEQLQKALAELRLLDRAKASFLSLISHELNTPLTVMDSFVALLGEKSATLPPDLQKAVVALQGASRRFSEIVSECLTYVKLESESRFHLQPFDLQSETTLLQKALEGAFREKKLKFSFRLIPPAPDFRCDVEKMQVALRKLLEDAVLRAPAGSEIRAEAGLVDGKVRYAVWRTGEPVSPEALRPLEFSNDALRHHRNLGLSLALCKLIVEGHGGELALISSTESGTTISLLFPRPSST